MDRDMVLCSQLMTAYLLLCHALCYCNYLCSYGLLVRYWHNTICELSTRWDNIAKYIAPRTNTVTVRFAVASDLLCIDTRERTIADGYTRFCAVNWWLHIYCFVMPSANQFASSVWVRPIMWDSIEKSIAPRTSTVTVWNAVASDLLCINTRERTIVEGSWHGSVQSIDDCILLCHTLC